MASADRPTLMKTLVAAACILLLGQPAQAATSCQASSGPTPPTVVELYTSEGCSSCPPADRWLSQLKGRPDVLALAFHVNYWDKLGWPDRFASAAATARQHQLAQLAKSSNVYTPQVVSNGRDAPDWQQWEQPPKAAPAAAAAAPALTLQREGDLVSVSITPAKTVAAQGAAYAGYWAVLEDQHQSKVRAGENAGETLKHDHVVRLYKPLPAWAARDVQRFSLQVSRGVPEFPRRVAFVVTDASGANPLQALTLGC